MQLAPNTIISGCNTGIGLQAALKLARDGHHIIMLVRNSEKSQQAYKQIKSDASAGVELIGTDLSDLSQCRDAIASIKAKYDRIDLLINNAGIYQNKREITPEGFEKTIAVNYLSPVLLSESLYPLMTESDDARIIHVSSTLYKNGKIPFENWHLEGSFSGTKAYANTKMMLLMHGLDLAERLKSKDISVNILHPGVIATDIFRNLPTFVEKPLRFFLKDAVKGSEPTVRLAIDPSLKGVSGQYFHEKKQQDIIPYGLNESHRAELMQITYKWLNLEKAA